MNYIAAEAQKYGREQLWSPDLNLSLGPMPCARCGAWGWAYGCGTVAEEHPEGPSMWGFIGDTSCYCGPHYERGNGLAEYYKASGPVRRAIVIPAELWEHYCAACVEALRPTIARLRDIFELFYEVNNLERAINEKRKGNKNNGPIAINARERGKGRTERRLGY